MNPHYLEVNGYSIRYVDKGKGSLLLLIHGFGGSLEWWKYNIETLSKNNRVIAFDFLGFGYSSKPKIDYNIHLISSFMRSFLDTLQIPSASLVGNSLGGLIALQTALKISQRIDKLVLVDSAGFGPHLSIYLRLGSLFPLGELFLSMRSFHSAKLFLSSMFYDHQKVPTELIPGVLEMFNQPRTKETCLQVLRYGVNLQGVKEKIWSPILEKLPSLPHPTLIVWGIEDQVIPVSHAYLGERLIQNSKLHLFEKCGHLPQVEWPHKFNRVVNHFLTI